MSLFYGLTRQKGVTYLSDKPTMHWWEILFNLDNYKIADLKCTCLV